jgi:hypothetical protein
VFDWFYHGKKINLVFNKTLFVFFMMKYYLIFYPVRAEKNKNKSCINYVLNKKWLNFEIILRVPKNIIILKDILGDLEFSNVSSALINLMNNQWWRFIKSYNWKKWMQFLKSNIIHDLNCSILNRTIMGSLCSYQELIANINNRIRKNFVLWHTWNDWDSFED